MDRSRQRSRSRPQHPASLSAVAILLFANVINLSADLAAMGDALGLIAGSPVLLYTIMFGGICLATVVFISYAKFAKVLKWGTLILLVYVATAFAVHIPLHQIITGSLVPRIRLSGVYMTALMAVLGTTISPYLFFWQAFRKWRNKKRRLVKSRSGEHRDRPLRNWNQCAQTRIWPWPSRMSLPTSSCWTLEPCCTLMGRCRLKRQPRRPRPSGRSAGNVLFSCLASASSGQGCWPSRCSQRPWVTRWPK